MLWARHGSSEGHSWEVTTPEQRKAFGEALKEVLDHAGMSGRGLAGALGLSPTAVSKWLRGRTTPSPETVAHAERVLDLDPGALSSALGYVILEASTNRQAPSVVKAVEADPRLGPKERTVLLTVYRELVRQYARARSEPTEPTD
jgi:transcriptional regulator with XRE-family HTH domain